MEQHRDNLMHDFLQVKDAIFCVEAHIFRSENQEKTKHCQVALKDLNEKVRRYCNGLGHELVWKTCIELVHQ
jgi:hypothetical protein